MNVVIFVNDELVDSAVTFLTFENKKQYLKYMPGDLEFETSEWNYFQNSAEDVELFIDYNSYKDNQLSTNYKVTIKPYHRTKPYLVIRIYDFKTKKYRKWYGYRTNEKFYVEIECPVCGINPRRR